MYNMIIYRIISVFCTIISFFVFVSTFKEARIYLSSSPQMPLGIILLFGVILSAYWILEFGKRSLFGKSR